MIQQHQREIVFTQKVIDIVLTILAWGSAFFIRFNSFNGEHGWYLNYILIAAFINYYCFKRYDLYGSQRLSSPVEESLTLIKACLISMAFTILLLYLVTPYKVSRLFLSYYAILLILMNISFRMILRHTLSNLRKQGKNLKYAIVIGDNDYLKHLVGTIKSKSVLGISFKGIYDSRDCFEDLNYIGSFEELISSTIETDYVIVGYKGFDHKKTEAVVNKFSDDLIQILVVPDLQTSYLGNHISSVFGNPVISINNLSFETTDILFKRSLDLIVSFIGLIILFPFLLMIGICVKITSPGPILYGQKRVGLDGKPFLMWKFRSMKIASKDESVGWTTPNDPRKTKLGSLLRKTSLDELPQLWNVLIGEMSLVGPRPEQPHFVEKFRSEIPAYMLRHKMKAGITGWAQINGWRGDSDIKARIECDIWYIKNWSIWLDLNILVQTIWKGFVNRNAY